VSEPISFRGRVRRWRDDLRGGLAVVDIPPELVEPFGGRRQFRVMGTLNGADFTGSTMLVAAGGFCVGVSRAALKAAAAADNQDVDVSLARSD
jgi:hypothetical protein